MISSCVRTEFPAQTRLREQTSKNAISDFIAFRIRPNFPAAALSARGDSNHPVTNQNERYCFMLLCSCCFFVQAEQVCEQRVAVRGARTPRQTNRTAMSSVGVPYK